MDFTKPTIFCKLVYPGGEYAVQTYRNQYYSLMTLVAGYTGMPGFGICSGMGSCGTCRVSIYDAYNKDGRSVLSCDTRVDDELSNTVIVVDGNDY
jgi:ferredoxin